MCPMVAGKVDRIVAGGIRHTVAGNIDTIGTAIDDIGVHVTDIATQPAIEMFGVRATEGNVAIKPQLL